MIDKNERKDRIKLHSISIFIHSYLLINSYSISNIDRVSKMNSKNITDACSSIIMKLVSYKFPPV